MGPDRRRSLTTREVIMVAPTKAQLLAFIKRRNKSMYSSNLQFQIDAEAAGFNVSDLGDAGRCIVGGIQGYAWATPHGRLVEVCGKLSLMEA
jgi:hypothetical protein